MSDYRNPDPWIAGLQILKFKTANTRLSTLRYRKLDGYDFPRVEFQTLFIICALEWICGDKIFSDHR